MLFFIAVAVFLKADNITGFVAGIFGGPQWNGTDSFNLTNSLTMNLSKYFISEQNETITYALTETKNISTTLVNDLLIILPKNNFDGTEKITLVASDSSGATRRTITINVAQQKLEKNISIKKVEEDLTFNTTIISKTTTNETLIILFSHDSPFPQPVSIIGNVNATLSRSLAFQNEIIELKILLVNGKVPRFRLKVGAKSDILEFGLVQTDPELEQKLLQKNKTEAIIIWQEIPVNLSNIEEVVSKRTSEKQELVQQIRNYTILEEYQTINAIVTNITTEQLQELQNNVLVKQIIDNKKFNLSLQDSIPLIRADLVHNTTLTTKDQRPTTYVKGSGQTVCILDTGIDKSLFKGRIIAEKDFVNNDNDATDDNGHGTQVSYVLAGNDDGLVGMAPEANIAAMKVCDNTGNCFASNILSAIDFCTANANLLNISAISGSFSDDGEYTSETCPGFFDESLLLAQQLGITNVFASGNKGYLNGISYPACSPYAISVGSSTKTDEVSSFSNRGLNLDVITPGENINTKTIGGSVRTVSGTSISTPFVSGLVALIQQHEKYNDRIIKPAQIEEIIKQNGVNVEGYSRTDAYKTIISLQNIIQPAPTSIPSPPPAQNATPPIFRIRIHSGANINACNQSIDRDVDLNASLPEINISDGSNCFIFNASNLIFDCQGLLLRKTGITGTSNAFNITNMNNITIRNCAIRNFNGAAIAAVNASNNTIFNNTINGSQSVIIFFNRSSHRNAIFNNSIIESNGNGDAITLSYSAVLNNITNNRIKVNGSGTGIVLLNDTNDTLINANTIVGTVGIDVGKVNITSTPRINITNNLINSSGSKGYGIHMINASNIFIINNSIITSGGSADAHGIFLETEIITLNITNNAINITADSSHGILLLNQVNDTFIFNNTLIVNSSSTDGIRVNDTANLNISRNYVLFKISSSTPGKMIYLLDTAINTLIANNTLLYANGTGGSPDLIFISGGSVRVNITNNTINMTDGGDIFDFSAASRDITIADNNILSQDSPYRSFFLRLADVNQTVIKNSYILNYSIGNATTFTIHNDTTGNITWPNQSSALTTGTNLSLDIRITTNRTFVNTTARTGFNVSANISLYSITFTDPKVAVDDTDDGTYADCAAATCPEVSFTSNIFKFNVTRFTSYAAQETSAGGATDISACSKNINTDSTLTTNISFSSGNCFEINASNIVFNCQGYNITGGTTTDFTFNITNFNNVTIKNCFLRGTAGAYIAMINSSNNTIFNITMNNSGVSNPNFPILMNRSTHGNIIANNSIETAGGNQVIYVFNSSRLTNITGNIFNLSSSSITAIFMRFDINDTIIHSNIIRHNGPIILINESRRTNITNNLLNSSSGGSDSIVVHIANSSDINIANNTIGMLSNPSSNSYSIFINTNSSKINITSNVINNTGSSYGIYLYGGALDNTRRNESRIKDVLIVNNTITINGSSSDAIRFNGTSNVNITQNFITLNNISQSGILLDNANWTVIFNNTFFNYNAESGATGSSQDIIRILGMSENTNITNNTINASANSDIFQLEELAKTTTIAWNNIVKVGNRDLVIDTINQTVIADQPIKNYSIKNATTFTIHNSTTGNITWTNVSPVTTAMIGPNLSLDIRITSNRTFVNTTAATGFNVSANISLFSITFTDPTPVFDPSDSGSYIACGGNCTEVSFTSNIYKFNVTRFTSFASQEAGAAADACPLAVSADKTLTTNLTGSATCITITSSNIFLNCAGYNITGASSGMGINISGFNNVTIRDCGVSNFTVGIHLLNSANSTLRNNTITNTSLAAILINQTSHNTSIYNNTIITTSVNAEGIKIINNSGSTNITLNIINITASNATALSNNVRNTVIFNNTIRPSGLFDLVIQDTNTTIIQEQDLRNYSITNATILTIHNISNGNVTFITNITVSGLNLSNDVRLRSNSTFVNTTARTGFNTTANVTLMGLTAVANPRAFADRGDTGTFTLCTTCTNISFSSNVFTFNTTSFTTLSGQSTPQCAGAVNWDTTFVENLTCAANGLNINASSITVNCAGFRLLGTATSSGINSTTFRNITIRDCTITNFTTGIHFLNTTNGTIRNNSVTNTSLAAILINQTSNSTSIYNNTIFTNSVNAEGIKIINDSVMTNISFNIINASASNATALSNNARFVTFLNNTIHPSGLFDFVARDINQTILQEQHLLNYSITNLTIFTVHNISNGNVTFITNITVSGLNLSNDIRIRTNSTFVNTTARTGFNTTANVTLMGLTAVANPRAFADRGDVGTFTLCTTCTNISYASNVFTFNTTSFTTLVAQSTLVCGSYVNDETASSLIENLTCTGTGLFINSSAIILNCNGFNISASGSNRIGINNTNFNNVTIRDCGLLNFSNSIYFINSSNSTLRNNTIINSTSIGIMINRTSNNNIIVNNTLIGFTSSEGIIITNTSNLNNISTNWINITSGGAGILLTTEINDTLINNNTINTIEDTADAIALSSSVKRTNITLNRINTTGEDAMGIHLISDTNNTIINNNTINTNTSFAPGIFIDTRSFNNIISNNTINTTRDNSTQLNLAFNTRIERNIILQNGLMAITIRDSNQTTIFEQGYTNYSITNATTFTIINNTNGNLTFLTNITVSGLNLSNDIRIRSNQTFVNTTARTGFNTTANISLFSINVGNAKVVFDIDDDGTFVRCNLCRNISYASNIFLFNTTRFTSFAIQNTTVCDDSVNSFVTMTSSLTCPGNGLNLIANNIDIDCAGYNITGTATGLGINISNFNNITIRNCGLTNFTNVIHLLNGSNITIRNNTITNTSLASILINQSSNLTSIYNNTIFTNSVDAEGIKIINNSNNINITLNIINASASNATALSNGAKLVFLLNNTIYASGLFDFVARDANQTIIHDQHVRNYSITNLTIFTIHNISNGNITFITNITVSGLNLSNDVRMRANSTFVNTTARAGFNTTANISLFNVNVTNPEIHVDTADSGTFTNCTTGCTSINLTANFNISFFNATSFTSYSIRSSSVAGVSCGSSVASDSNVTSNLTCTASGVHITNSSLILNCQGSAITGALTGVGINITNANNVTIKDCSVSNFTTGISMQNSSNITIRNYTITNVTLAGIYLNQSSNNSIFNNTIITNRAAAIGILVENSSDNANITLNIINASASNGTQIINSKGTLIINNTMHPSGLFDLVIRDANQTSIIDQAVRNYSITNATIFTIHNISNGNITFITNITVSGLNLSNDIRITTNNTFVNTTARAGFNTTANISLFGLSDITNPEAIVDAEDDGTFIICPPTRCGNISFSNNIFKFNTTQFSTYAARDILPTVPAVLRLPGGGSAARESAGRGKTVVAKKPNETETPTGFVPVEIPEKKIEQEKERDETGEKEKPSPDEEKPVFETIETKQPEEKITIKKITNIILPIIIYLLLLCFIILIGRTIYFAENRHKFRKELVEIVFKNGLYYGILLLILMGSFILKEIMIIALSIYAATTFIIIFMLKRLYAIKLREIIPKLPHIITIGARKLEQKEEIKAHKLSEQLKERVHEFLKTTKTLERKEERKTYKFTESLKELVLAFLRTLTRTTKTFERKEERKAKTKTWEIALNARKLMRMLSYRFVVLIEQIYLFAEFLIKKLPHLILFKTRKLEHKEERKIEKVAVKEQQKIEKSISAFTQLKRIILSFLRKTEHGAERKLNKFVYNWFEILGELYSSVSSFIKKLPRLILIKSRKIEHKEEKKLEKIAVKEQKKVDRLVDRFTLKWTLFKLKIKTFAHEIIFGAKKLERKEEKEVDRIFVRTLKGIDLWITKICTRIHYWIISAKRFELKEKTKLEKLIASILFSIFNFAQKTTTALKITFINTPVPRIALKNIFENINSEKELKKILSQLYLHDYGINDILDSLKKLGAPHTHIQQINKIKIDTEKLEKQRKQLLKKYIETNVKKNISAENISQTLTEAGWTRKTAEPIVQQEIEGREKQILRKYIKHLKNKGITKEQTWHLLADNGWPEKLVNEILGKETQTTAKEHYEKEALEKYVDVLLKRKVPKQEIKIVLENAGWPTNLIDKALGEKTKETSVEYYKKESVYRYAVNLLKTGISKETIKSILLNAGWPKTIVNQELKTREPTPQTKIHQYITKAFEKGLTEREIISALTEKGWTLPVVREEIERHRIGLILSYAEKARKRGLTKTQIIDLLETAGWERKDIDKATKTESR